MKETEVLPNVVSDMKQWEQAGRGTTVQFASMGVGVKSLPEPLVRGLLTIPDVEVKEVCRAAEGLVEAGAPGEGKVDNVVFTLAFLVRGSCRRREERNCAAGQGRLATWGCKGAAGGQWTVR